MAARTARTLLLAGAGVGLLAAVSLARRVSARGSYRSSAPDRLPVPRHHPQRRASAAPAADSGQEPMGEAVERQLAEDEAARSNHAGVARVVPGPLPRPLIPAQRRAS